MKVLILLVLITSCGKSEQLRCYTKEEALNYCIAKRIAETGESTFMANYWCKPKYTVDFCYSLKGI
jgi:hypothetical protein